MQQHTDEQIQSTYGDSTRRYPAGELRRALWLIFVAWIFGAGFLSITTGAALTSFLTRYLHTSDFTYGLIMSAGPAAVLFFFLGSYINERTGRIKRNFLIFASTHRLLWLGVAAIPVLIAGVGDTVKVVLVGVIMFLSAAACNFGGGGWLTWMSDIVPRRSAGAYFGSRASAGMVSMVITTVIVAALLDRYAGSVRLYALVFAVAAILGTMDILTFSGVREVPRPVEPQPPTMRDILVAPWKNAIFRGFTIYTCVSFIAYMASGPFMWRFCFDPVAKNGLGMSLSQANLVLFIIPMLAMAITSPMWGRAIDRFGPKPVLATSALGAILFPLGWVVMHHGIAWLLYPMVMLGGLSWPGIDQTLAYMQVKGFPDERRTAYCASFQVVFGLSSVIGTTLGGVLATFWKSHLVFFPWLPSWVSHYHPLFLCSILLRLIALCALLLPLKLPGSTSMRQVAQAVAAEIPVTVPGMSGKRAKRR